MDLDTVRPLKEIIHFLQKNISLLREKQILAGFDGFIDTIVKPLRRFSANGEPEFFHTIDEFGVFIAEHSHKSTSIQYEVLTKKPGGNMPNFVMAMDALPLYPTAIGMLSAESGDIDPIFKELGKQRYSYLAAGPATALEFNDGKIFLSPATIAGIDCDEKVFPRIEKAFPLFSNAVANADLTAFLNWSELPFAQDLWNDIYTHTFDSAKTDKGRIVFFDLCDTGAKNLPEIEAVLSLIAKISARRKTILSMNKNETLDIYKKITGQSQSCSASEAAQLLFERITVDELVVHQHTESIALSAEGMVRKQCILNNNPKISTGAGDHFNAAYCLASLAGLPIAEKLTFANAYSGAYIAKGSGPSLDYVMRHHCDISQNNPAAQVR